MKGKFECISFLSLSLLLTQGWLGEADTVSATELSRMEEEFLLTNKIKKQKSKYFGREEEFILRKLVCRFFWLF